MKRLIALILVIMVFTCGALAAFAEGDSTGGPPRMDGGPGGMGTPPEKPDG